MTPLSAPLCIQFNAGANGAGRGCGSMTRTVRLATDAGRQMAQLTIRRLQMGRPKTPPSVAWLCSKCRQVIRTYVRLSEPPICSGGGKHTPQKMEALDGK